jgi:hypothetical protein
VLARLPEESEAVDGKPGGRLSARCRFWYAGIAVGPPPADGCHYTVSAMTVMNRRFAAVALGIAGAVAGIMSAALAALVASASPGPGTALAGCAVGLLGSLLLWAKFRTGVTLMVLGGLLAALGFLSAAKGADYPDLPLRPPDRSSTVSGLDDQVHQHNQVLAMVPGGLGIIVLLSGAALAFRSDRSRP